MPDEGWFAPRLKLLRLAASVFVGVLFYDGRCF
jgi:hypothetical protein